MKMKQILKKTSLALVLASLMIGIADAKTAVNASADTANLTSFNMIGASVRPDLPSTEKDDSGIRFASRISKTEFASLTGVTETGTLMIPRRLLGEEELVRGNEDAIELSTLGTQLEGDDYYEFRTALYAIPENSYTSGIVARSYIVANGTTYYTEEIERSISYVANRAFEEGGYDTSLTKLLRKFQTVSADANLKIDYTAGVPVRNAEPVNFTEDGESLSMEFTVVENLDDSNASGTKRMYFGINSAAGKNIGQTNGSNIFVGSEVSYQGQFTTHTSVVDNSAGWNIQKLFTAGNKVKTEYVYSTQEGGCAFSVYVQTPSDSDYVKLFSRVGVPKIQNAYIGMWDISGDYTTVFNNLTFKNNGVQTETMKYVYLSTESDIERVYAEEVVIPTINSKVTFTGGNAHISAGISETGESVFNLDFNQTLVWEFDITQASMNSRIGFYVSESERLGNDDYSDGARLNKVYSVAMLEYQLSGQDWWYGTDATPQAKRNYSNIFRAGFCYKIEYKTPSSATANDGSLIIWEKAKADKDYITVRCLTGIKTGVASSNGTYAPMKGVKFSIMAIGVSTATSFTMENAKCYVVETGVSVGGYTKAGGVTIE